MLLGDSGGKSHLLIGLGIAACEQGRRVRYVTADQLVNELVEAADERRLSRIVARYGPARPALPRPMPTPQLCRPGRQRDLGDLKALGSVVVPLAVAVGIVPPRG